MYSATLMLALAGASVVAPALQTQTDREVQVVPQPPRGALEQGLDGSAAGGGRAYAGALALLREGRRRDALALVREARALAWKTYEEGGAFDREARSAAVIDRRQAYRHFCRIAYAEELLSELTERDRQLQRMQDHMAMEDRLLMLQERAVLVHRELLLFRGLGGQFDPHLLRQAVLAYEQVVEQPGALRATVLAGYAGLLAATGDRRAARAKFAQISEEDRKSERLDLQVAAYQVAMGDRQRALSRLRAAARRDGWDHGSATQDGRTLRGMVYRMNEFDELRETPGFTELVTGPEERDR